MWLQGSENPYACVPGGSQATKPQVPDWSDLPPSQPVGEMLASVAPRWSCCFSLQRKAE